MNETIEIRQCSKCRNEYPATPEFFFRNKDNLDYYCKKCRRQYTQDHKEEIRKSIQKQRDFLIYLLNR